MVEAGFGLYFADRAEGLAFHQQALIGHVSCLIGRALAELISQPEAWRIAALVSTARLLSPWIGLNAAAMTSASSVRQFEKALLAATSPVDGEIAERACADLQGHSAQAMAELAASIAARLESSADGAGAAEYLRKLHAGS